VSEDPDRHSLLTWYEDDETQAALGQARRSIPARDIPYLQLLLLAELFDWVMAMSPDEDEDDESEEPWKRRK
jgi:hypothetical protein